MAVIGTPIKKHLNFLFLDTAPGESAEAWKRVGTATDFAHAMNAETEAFDYIADENPTEELKSYKPTLAQTQAAHVGDPIYDFVFRLYKTQATGGDAVTKAMIVYQQKVSTEEDAGNEAIQFNALITIDTYDFVAKTITYTISQRGTPVHGSAKVVDEKPTFTPAA